MRESPVIGSREHQLEKINRIAGLEPDGLAIKFDEGVKVYQGPNPAWLKAQTVHKPLPPGALERVVGWGLATAIMALSFGLGWLLSVIVKAVLP